MSVKILAFDLDGTSIVLHKSLPDQNRRALINAAAYGTIIVPATGRLRTFLPKELLSIPQLEYVISSNGAAVDNIKTGECIYRALIPNSKAIEVQSILSDYDIYIEYYSDGEAITLSGNPERARTDLEFPSSKHHFLTKHYSYIDDFESFVRESGVTPEKINLPYLPVKLRNEISEKLKKLSGIKLTSSIPDNIEINASDATKGNALKALCSHLCLSSEECMAIGDNGNDIDMLKFAAYSVAVANASQEAASAAKFTTDTCENFGLAKAIERFIL